MEFVAYYIIKSHLVRSIYSIKNKGEKFSLDQRIGTKGDGLFSY